MVSMLQDTSQEEQLAEEKRKEQDLYKEKGMLEQWQRVQSLAKLKQKLLE